jgi:hypothetical protein
LSAHININDPDYKVFTLIGWERREVKEAGGFVGTLESATKMPYLELATEASKVVILFDEAQDSYWDEELWLEFFKALELGMGLIVILFASFGACRHHQCWNTSGHEASNADWVVPFSWITGRTPHG